jgi:hypothetical protein
MQLLDWSSRLLASQLGGQHELHPARDHHAVRGAGHRHRHGRRSDPAEASPPGVPAGPQAGRQGLPRRRTALGDGQSAAHKRVEIRDWMAASPRIHVHFTPTSGSWLNLVEVWFGIIQKRAIHRGTSARFVTSTARSGPSSTGGTTAATPSSGPKPPTKSSTKANRPTTSPTRH